MQTPLTLGGRYRLEDVLGVGGMSMVWRAHDEVLGRFVAVKVLSGRFAAEASYRQRIREEARAAAALSHPNIAQVYDFGESGADGQLTPYVVMELVAGPTLEVRAAAGDLPPRLVLRICAEVAAALAAAHAEGLVHRDIKPANVMLATAGAKVVDFGIAAAVGAADDGDPDGRVFGTPQYLAPERLAGGPVEPASDVYSLGVLLYKLLAGHSPWTASTPTEILDAHLHLAPEPLPAHVEVPSRVVDLYLRCLAKEPSARPSAGEVALTLAEAAGIRTVEDDLAHSLAPLAADGGPSSLLVRRVRPAATPAPPGAGHHRRARIVVALLAGTVVGALVWGLLPGAHRVPPAEAEQRAAPAPPAATGPTAPPSSPAAAARPHASAGGTATPGPAGSVLAATVIPPAPGAPSSAPVGTDSPAPVSVPPRTFTTDGGSVTAECTADDRAHLLSWTPVEPYKVKKATPGPARTAGLKFKHGNDVITIDITCTDGTPSAAVGTE